MSPDKHLDLGCGTSPRNPYNCSQLFGVDIREVPPMEDFQSRVSNLSLEPIPYDDNMFGSVSGFDFIEHIPRVLAVDNGEKTIFPFIQLMNEIWRVLAPGGRFYAVTPAFPQPEAFVDPTHVNIITDKTHSYFCGEECYGRAYGFIGNFKPLVVAWTKPEWTFKRQDFELELEARKIREQRKNRWHKKVAHQFRDAGRSLRGKPLMESDDRLTHLLWELEAVK